MMFICIIYSLALCWGNASNSNVTMKFAQLHYFLSQNVGGGKDIISPLSKSWGGHVLPVPSHKLGPCLYLFTGFCISIYNRIKFSYYVFLLEKSKTCHISMILWE